MFYRAYGWRGAHHTLWRAGVCARAPLYVGGLRFKCALICALIYGRIAPLNVPLCVHTHWRAGVCVRECVPCVYACCACCIVACLTYDHVTYTYDDVTYTYDDVTYTYDDVTYTYDDCVYACCACIVVACLTCMPIERVLLPCYSMGSFSYVCHAHHAICL